VSEKSALGFEEQQPRADLLRTAGADLVGMQLDQGSRIDNGAFTTSFPTSSSGWNTWEEGLSGGARDASK